MVVINIWGQWCGPCRAEIAQLQQVYDKTHGRGVAFLGIDVRDNDIDAPARLRQGPQGELSVDLRPGHAFFDRLRRQVPDDRHPSTVVLDREHRVAAVFLRELLAEDLLPVVQRLAAEPPPRLS